MVFATDCLHNWTSCYSPYLTQTMIWSDMPYLVVSLLSLVETYMYVYGRVTRLCVVLLIQAAVVVCVPVKSLHCAH